MDSIDISPIFHRDVNELLTQLHFLRDEGSYDGYFEQFIRRVFPMERFLTPKNEEFFLEELLILFVDGLQEETRLYVWESAPSNLHNAMNLANYYEDVIKQERMTHIKENPSLKPILDEINEERINEEEDLDVYHSENFVSKMMVDLAGSKRVGKIEVEGEMLKESQFIKSLSALGDVIYALVSKNPHIPYRNSMLTHLLQSSLRGDCKTIMFTQISQSSTDLGETLCSLNFASRVREIENGPARKKSDPTESHKLKQMVEKLRQEDKDNALLFGSMTLCNWANFQVLAMIEVPTSLDKESSRSSSCTSLLKFEKNRKWELVWKAEYSSFFLKIPKPPWPLPMPMYARPPLKPPWYNDKHMACAKYEMPSPKPPWVSYGTISGRDRFQGRRFDTSHFPLTTPTSPITSPTTQTSFLPSFHV